MSSAFLEFREDEVEQSISDRFEQQVARYGTRLAVRTRVEELTYAALNRHANRIAHWILAECGDASEPVGLLLGQGAPLISAILAVLKAGKLYVPLDPAVPEARIGDVLRESGTRIVLTDTRTLPRTRAPFTDNVVVLQIDRIAAGLSTKNPSLAIDPESPAYLFYTSGSTGRPKGVVDIHRNVLHNIRRYTNSLRIACTDRLTLLQSCGFSGSVSNVFGALLNGAAVFPFDLRTEGIDRVAAWLHDERITIYHSVPSIFRHLATGDEEFPDLRIIRLEGDQASSRDAEIYRNRFPDSVTLINGLGATECGLVRQYVVDKKTPVESGALPVGYAVPDVDVLVVGEHGEPLEIGAIGEIAVRSRFLAPGYWRDPERTARAFAADPDRPSERVYRTGDLGRLRADGCLVHLGRKDARKKVRGHLIDVAEVEAALLALDDVQEAVVAVHHDERAEPRIVAYVVPPPAVAPTVTEFRRQLSGRLPDYMLPSAFVLVRNLPLTSDGKVDRRALPSPSRARPPLECAYREAVTRTERLLADIWAEVLELERVGVDDDFFDLGGDSLHATRVAHRICTEAGGRLAMTAIFENRTVASLAQRLDSSNRR